MRWISGASSRFRSWLSSAHGYQKSVAGFWLLSPTGSVVVYSTPFETSVLNRLALTYPQQDAWVGSAPGRMVDLLEPFKGFDYYHPDQRGSASIKAVLPALTGRTYSDLAIQNVSTPVNRPQVKCAPANLAR